MAVTVKNTVFWDMTHVALAGTDVSEEHIASIMRVKIISELGTTLTITSS
jgi:hypothetical protein